jgi:predicted nucleotidyltransferase
VKAIEELLRPPAPDEVRGALRRVAEEIRRRYGARLRGLYLFGSRARGDHRPDSDADLAVVLADGDWRYWDEKISLVDLIFDLNFDVNLYVQPWPFSESEWSDPEGSPQAKLLRSAQRDARPLQEMA